MINLSAVFIVSLNGRAHKNIGHVDLDHVKYSINNSACIYGN